MNMQRRSLFKAIAAIFAIPDEAQLADESASDSEFVVRLYSGSEEASYSGYARVVVERNQSKENGSFTNPCEIVFPECTGSGQTVDGVRIVGGGFDTGVRPLTVSRYVSMGITPLFARASITYNA